MTKLDFKKWNELSMKKNLTGEDAIKAVEQDGYALRFVKDQTEAICIKAVEQNGYALQFVCESIISKKPRYTKAELCKILGVEDFDITL